MASSPAKAAVPDAETTPAALSSARERSDSAAVRARVNALIARIDRDLGRQLDAILHHPAFKKLEALWRGVRWLIDDLDDPSVCVRILDVRWTEIARDLERALDFDQSTVFDLVYSQEFGMPGGRPYGMVVVDHAVSHRLGRGSRVDDVEVLEGLMGVAAAAFTPFVFGVDPAMLALDQLDEIDLRQELGATFADPQFGRWNRMRLRPDSRFLAGVVTRLLVRHPHRGRDHPRLGFVYDEKVSDTRDLLWLHGGFALAHVALRAMARHRWPAAIRGTVPPGEGGLVDGPVRHFIPSDEPGFVVRYPVEAAVSEGQEVVLNDNGLLALRQMHLTGNVAFMNLPSLHRPPDYDGEAARMNAKMGGMLNYVLCVARFAHYVKVIARDWVGKYNDAAECERLLQRWLQTYVTGNDDASPEMRVRYPLREGRVSVAELPGKPGSYGCDIYLRPHYQLDQITSEFRLTTVIGTEGAG
ncbi:type VI secretion system contractile sheath large subunit [Novosphingobium sp.]|uniref:type VI secretion system contractile sheath large subunit n=1 Tax=Novosphingobium sp. TaxID=1874826 RepID=UPI001D587ECE|nr:type VI secretion system contractile sheath large subunit [Novosphingobium sp.]MBX9662979.1 type VI secretion system contractile sheath large subunit [Novosphingobium sp.]